MDAKFLVPFETARQLKEKGYDVNCYNYYTQNGELYCGVFPMNNNLVRIGCCTAPTYHEVLDWLQEKGKIIFAEYRVYENYWAGFIRGINGEMEYLTEFPTREEALNEGILAALKKL